MISEFSLYPGNIVYCIMRLRMLFSFILSNSRPFQCSRLKSVMMDGFLLGSIGGVQHMWNTDSYGLHCGYTKRKFTPTLDTFSFVGGALTSTESLYWNGVMCILSPSFGSLTIASPLSTSLYWWGGS
jgi:hypothetical protein